MVSKIKTVFTSDTAKMYCFFFFTVTAAVLTVTGASLSVYVEKSRLMYLGSYILSAFLIFFGIVLKPRNKEVSISPIPAAVMLAVDFYLLPDLVMGSYFPKSSYIYVLMGLLLCLFLFMLAAAVPISPKILFIVFEGIISFLAFMQYYIVMFRGNPIQFSDFFNVRSGLAIKGEYEFKLMTMPVFAVLHFAAVTVVIVRTRFKKLTLRPRLITAGITLASFLCVILSGRYCYDLGIRNRYIRLGFSGSEVTDSYRQVGFNLMFCYDGLYNRVEIPDGYSDEKGRAFVELTEKPEEPEKKPVIIGILNESFADFRHIDEFSTNKEFMPNYMALKNEAVTGYISVSAYGGYSCNSEYEFLTGNTMAFLPPGSAAFTQYLDDKQWGLVTWLKELGYYTKTVSPCSEWLWSIGSAYENLQFDERIYDCQDKMQDKTYVNGELSDCSLYKYLEQQFERRNKEKGLFLWTATMQNHGPYEDLSLVPSEITFEGYNNDEALQYLNSIYSADQALGELLDYFRNVDEEVIIVFFGDHYPHIPSFSEYLYGASLGSLSVEDYSRLRQTPFFIWDNKGTEAKEIESISLNYLSNELMEVADMPKAPYHQELDKIREKIPSISSYGYMTDEKKWYESTETAEGYEDILNEYKTMQYYRIFKQYKDK